MANLSRWTVAPRGGSQNSGRIADRDVQASFMW
jgi:hypothetical protein